MTRRHEIVRVARIDHRIEPYDWAFAREEAARIDAHWAEQCRRMPGLFDGLVLLAHRAEIVGDCLHGACFATRYRNFLSWRDFGFPGEPLVNCFAMAALRAVDGAFMLGEMSPSTANAGRLYFPAGTPEPADADTDGYVHFDANVLRELEEETGLSPAEIELGDGWTVVFDGPCIGCMKLVSSSQTAAALQARLALHNAAEVEPELVRLWPVWSEADFDPSRMPAFMLHYLRAMLREQSVSS